MLKQEKIREFNTVEEVFDTYMESYKITNFEDSYTEKVNMGTQLTSALLKEFEKNLNKSLKKIKQ